MKPRTIMFLVVALVPLAAGMNSAGADDVRTILKHDTDGAYVVHEHDALARQRSETQAPRQGPLPIGRSVIWHNNLTDAVYTTTGISLASESLATGTWLNPPIETQVIPLEGGGTAAWVFPCAFYPDVAVSKDADTIAMKDGYNGTTVNLYKWHAASSVPDWSFVTPPVWGYWDLAVSRDGSTIALLVTIMGSPNYGRLYYFDAASPTPLGTFTPVIGTTDKWGRSVDITDDGKYIAVNIDTWTYVIDRDTTLVRDSFDVGANTEALAISGDGDWLAGGFQTLIVRHWNGTSYAPVWSLGGGGNYLRQCDISSDSSTLAAAWYRAPAYDQNIAQLFDVSSSVPIWTYNSAIGGGAYQMFLSDIAVTADGSHVAVAGWGDQFNTDDEIIVFKRDSPVPVFSVDTPGSMFDVDIAKLMPCGKVYVSACGKHVHANQMGRGGDLYSIRVQAEIGPFNILDFLTMLGLWGQSPSPCPPYVEMDLNCDCWVDVSDFLILIANWG